MTAPLVRAVVALAMVGSAVAQTGHGCGEAFTDTGVFVDCTPLLPLCFNNSVSQSAFPARACVCRLHSEGTLCVALHVIDGRIYDACLRL